MAAILMLAAVGGFLGLVLRQPLIVSFIAVGILAGPSVLGIAQSEEHLDLLAELGIAVLLFLVGLKLDIKLVRELGGVAVITGLGQVAFTSLFGFLIGLALGLDFVTSVYVAVALTFSSTIIIVKLLSDKREVDSLHGRIALGFLIVQDLVVVFAMLVLSAVAAGTAGPTGGLGAFGTVVSGAVLLVAVGVFARYLATPLITRLASARELLICFAIGWAALLAAIGDWLGFGKELGGLLAGVSLASTPFREAIAARLAPLRDFLLLFFFIALGAGLDLGTLGDAVGPAIVFSVFVLVGNPLIVLVIMGVMGYRKRTGFLAGLTVAQISEFSLIFMGTGVALGHVAEQALGLVTLVGLVTIALSTYMITWSGVLYRHFEPYLGIFERSRPAREEEVPPPSGRAYDAIVVGLGRYGGGIVQHLRNAGWRVLGLDFDPIVVRRRREEGLDAMFGDASDPEFVAGLPLQGVRWVVSAAPLQAHGVTHDDVRMALIEGLNAAGYEGRVAVATQRDEEMESLRGAGADLVFTPFRDAAARAAELVLDRRVEGGADVLPEPEDQREIVD